MILSHSTTIGTRTGHTEHAVLEFGGTARDHSYDTLLPPITIIRPGKAESRLAFSRTNQNSLNYVCIW
ncbi:hypothetical protein FVER53590_29934 [Fusarium verticillioides]|nr:hypothetical protein FVER53590_29934 [Fusarium verticillioides]